MIEKVKQLRQGETGQTLLKSLCELDLFKNLSSNLFNSSGKKCVPQKRNQMLGEKSRLKSDCIIISVQDMITCTDNFSGSFQWPLLLRELK